MSSFERLSTQHTNQESEPQAKLTELLAEMYRVQKESLRSLPGVVAAYQDRMVAIKSAQAELVDTARNVPGISKFEELAYDHTRSHRDLRERLTTTLHDATVLRDTLSPDVLKRFAHIQLSPEELQSAFDAYVQGESS